MRYSKYHSKKVTYQGMSFDSKKERDRYIELSLMEKAGEITELKRQVKFLLMPSQFGIEAGKRVCLERECSYIADFTYTDKNEKFIVEDTKGFRTPEYIIKRKYMLFHYGIRIKEV